MTTDGESPGQSVYRQMARDTVVYGLGRVAGYAAGLLLMPVYTHCLTVEDYGALENLLVLAGFLGTLVPLGLPDALQRFWFLAPPDGAPRRVVGSALAGTGAALAIAIIPLVVFAGPLTTAWFGKAELVPAFRIAAVSLLPSALLAISLALLRARFRASVFAICSVTQVVLLAGLNSWLVAGAGLGVTGVLLGGTISALLAAAFGLFASRQVLSVRASWLTLRSMLAYSLPLVPAALSFWALSWLDRIILTRVAGLHETGLYAAAARVAGVLFFVNFAANSAFHPLALRIAGDPEAPRVYARALTGFLALASWAAVALTALSREAIAILAPPEYGGAHRVVGLLAAGLVLAGTSPFLTIGIHVLRRTMHITWVAMTAAAVAAGLCLLLTPPFGFRGAAVACLAGNGILAVLYFIVGQRVFPFPLEGRRILRAVLIAAAAGIGAVLLDRPEAASVAARAALAALFPLLLVAGGVLRPREIRALLCALRPGGRERG